MSDLLVDLAAVMVVAALVTVLCHKLRQPVVLGYLIAGVLIGPYLPHMPFTVSEPANVETLAQFGVVMLMFGLGLEFSLGKLLKVIPTAMTAVTLEIVLMVWIGYQVGLLLGFPKMQSMMLGAMLLSSSTIISIHTLNDLKLTGEKFAQMVFGILILDDIYAIIAIVLITGLAATETFSAVAALDVAKSIGIFLTVTFVVGLLVVPHLLRYVANLKNDELLLITVLGLGFGISMLGVKLGYSAALGAFVIGAIIAETRMQGKVNELINPIRYMFNAIFFVAVGMMLDPAVFLEYWPHILLLTAVVMVGKTVTGALGSMVAGHDLRTALRVGMGLAQIGEFAFVIGQLGMELGKIPQWLYSIIIGVSALTTLLTPYMIKHSESLANAIERPIPKPVLDMLAVYHRWFHRNTSSPMYAPVKKLVRKTIMQIVLNMVLVAAIFIIAAFATDHTADLWPEDRRAGWWLVAHHSIFWLAAMAMSMPLVAATFRKLRAMAMLLAEVSITSAAARQRTQIMRMMFVNTILAAGMLGMGVYLLLLSSAIMPPWPVLAILLVGLAIFTRYRWNTFIQFYAAAQAEIGETLFTPEAMPDEAIAEPPKPLPPLLYAAELEMVSVEEGSCIIGQFLRETELRALTGASVVGIERKGENIVNPSADEEVQLQDNLLLLGTRTQLAAARDLIMPPSLDQEPQVTQGPIS